MEVEVPIDESFEPERYDNPAAGKAHTKVIRHDWDGGQGGEMVVDFEVLAHSEANQEGKVQREYYSKSIKAMGRIHTFAIACGLITAAEIRQHKANGTAPKYDWSKAIHRHVFLDLKEEEYNGKTRVKCNFDMYHPNDPKVRNWPRCDAMLKQDGYTVEPQQKPAPQPATAPAATPAPATSPDELDLDGVV